MQVRWMAAVAVGAVLTGVGTAEAVSVRFTGDHNTNPGPRSVVSLYLKDTDNTWIVNGTKHYVGLMNWTGWDAANEQATDEAFQTFCIEIAQEIRWGDTPVFDEVGLHEAPIVGRGSGLLNDDRAWMLERFWHEHFEKVGTDGHYAAAFQLGLWDIIYDGDTGLGAGGQFWASGSVWETAKAWLGGTNFDQQLPRTRLGAWSNGQYQDQIIPVAVPTPAAAMAGVFGLGAMALRRRREA